MFVYVQSLTKKTPNHNIFPKYFFPKFGFNMIIIRNIQDMDDEKVL